ncbi:MAG: hypothetical protein U5K56_19400 [Halioglobus sp.]|nr:hypothetical protein [Halioglobus sp.]
MQNTSFTRNFARLCLWFLLATTATACLAAQALAAAESGSEKESGENAGAESEVVHVIDFTGKPAGSAFEWLRENGYELHLDAASLDLRFSDKGLVLHTDGRRAGLIERELQLPRASRIRMTWGVEEYPEGANWEEGVYRIPIAIMISFGEKDIESGSFFVPDAPYFISLFLSENAEPDKAYTANYYHKGGRYFCQPCSPPEGQTVTTEFDLEQAFRNQFDQQEVPPVTAFGFQMNTEDTAGGARAFLARAEFLAD